MYFNLFIYGLFVSVFIQNSLVSLSEAKRTKCKRKYKLKATLTHIERKHSYPVLRGSILCTGPKIIYEIRYSNGSLCSCGEFKKEFRRVWFTCQDKLSLDQLSLVIDVSTNKIKNKDSFLKCDINLELGPIDDEPLDYKRIQIRIPKKSKERFTVLNEPVTSYITSNVVSTSISSTLIDQSSFTPSSLSQSPTRISTKTSSKLPSLMVSPLISHFYMADHQNPSNTPTLHTKNPLPTLGLPTPGLPTPGLPIPGVPTPLQSVHHTPVSSTTLLPTQSVLMTTSPNEFQIPKITSSVIQPSPSTGDISFTSSTTFSSETEEEKKFKEDVEFINNFNTSTVDIDDTEAIGRVLDAVTNLIATNQTTADQKQDPGEQAVEVLQDLGNSLSQQLNLGNESVVTFEKVTDDLVFGVAVINVTTSSEFSFPSEKDKTTGDEKIVIPNSVFNSNNLGKAYFVGIIFKAYREMRNNTGNKGFVMGTKVINAVVSPALSDVLKEPVEMMFEKKIAGESLATKCSFWIENWNSSFSGEYGRWSTKQCYRTFENKTHIKCACYHFTNFAVLFKVSDDQDALLSSPVVPPTSTTTLSPETEKDKKFKEDVEFINNFNASTVDVDDTEAIGRVLDAVTNLIATNQTTADQKQDPGEQAVEVLQDLGNSLSQQLNLGNESVVTFEKVTDDLVFGVAVINVTTSSEFSFPSEKDKTTGDEKIVIPNSVFNSNNLGKAYFVGIIFKAYREMRNNTGNKGFVMGTKVINAVVSPAPSDVLKEPVEMTFEKNIAGESLATKCSYWIEDSSQSGEYGRWSTKQCWGTSENETHIKCACHHFTNFAVLFKVSDDQNISEEDTFRLVIITYIGLSLSILGCLLTFIIYVTLQNIKSDRAIIHVNLVLALGIADVIFLVTVAVKPVKDWCLAAAMLAFYFYLAVFFWMLVEGVYIYLMAIKVFRGNVARRRRLAYLVGWVCPFLIAIITYAALRDDVVSKYHCWLSVESGAIWAFVGPGLFIILINCVILLTVVKTTWTTFSDDKEFGGLKSATKTFGAIIPILGITWVFGVMAFNESSVVFQYIFAITNSIQGALIFVLYCLVNKEVRTELHRRRTIWQTRREMTSSSGGRRHVPQATKYGFRNPAQEMKEKKEAEHSSLLDDINQTETTTKESEISGNCSPVGNVSPVRKNGKIDQSFDSIGHV